MGFIARFVFIVQPLDENPITLWEGMSQEIEGGQIQTEALPPV